MAIKAIDHLIISSLQQIFMILHSNFGIDCHVKLPTDSCGSLYDLQLSRVVTVEKLNP